jgi:hypothetical protein
VDKKLSSSLVLLTYKNKALLMSKQENALDTENHIWSFIESVKGNQESVEIALSKRVEKETGVKIGKVEYVSDSCYHACLTDDNVNRIERQEGQLLSFFSIREIQDLPLSGPTREFVTKHGILLE